MTKICNNCGTSNKETSKFCANCGAEIKIEENTTSNSKGVSNWWKSQNNGVKGITIVGICCLGLFLIIGIFGMITPDAPSTEIAETVPSAENTTTVDQEPTTTVSQEPATTVSQDQAVEMAESYLRSQSFSRQGLIEQLEYEGFTNEEAKYAVDQISVDWNEQAAKKAESYLSSQSFSRQGLIEQLEYEGFTSEQAKYGVQSVGL